MGSSTIGIPDVSALPIQSPTNAYDLRNASAAFSPQPLPPEPGGIGQSVVPGSTEDLEQRSLQSFQNPPQFQQPDFQQPQFQQPQFQPAPQHDLQPLIDQAAAHYQQQNQQRGQGVMKHLLTSFLGGMGRSMMVHAGLPSPEEQQQRQLQNVILLSHAQSEQQNAQANQELKNIETERYRMDVAKYPVYDPQGNPYLDDQGKPKLYPGWQAKQLQSDALERAKQQRLTPEQQSYLDAHQQLIAQGKSPLEARQALEKQPADISPDRETFNYYTRPKAQGGLGLTEGQAYDKMHPRSNINLMTSTDAKDIADAIENGDQPPTTQGLYRNAGPVRAELARRGFPLAQAEMDWKAVNKHLATLNGPQQTRLVQSISSANDLLDKVDGLYGEWKQLAPVSGYKIANHAALVGMKNLPGRAGAVANALDTQLSELTADLGNIYMGGNSPTDQALKLGAKALSSDWGPEAFEEGIKQARLNVKIRQNSIMHSQPVGVSSGSPYAPAAAPAPPANDFFSQFGGKSR